MSFITLARELGSISEADVVRLSELLGMDCIGKEFVEKRFEEIGMPTDSLREYDEKKPGFFARLFRGEPDHYLDTLRNILYFEVLKDNKLIVGRGANFLFAGIPNCLRVKLVASKEIRLKNIMEWEGCTIPVAQAMMDKSDRDRAGFCLFHYNEDWYAANSYDVVVKTDTLSLETLAPFLLCAMKSIMTRERDEQGQKLLDDKMLVNRIVFRLSGTSLIRRFRLNCFRRGSLTFRHKLRRIRSGIPGISFRLGHQLRFCLRLFRFGGRYIFNIGNFPLCSFLIRYFRIDVRAHAVFDMALDCIKGEGTLHGFLCRAHGFEYILGIRREKGIRRFGDRALLVICKRYAVIAGMCLRHQHLLG